MRDSLSDSKKFAVASLYRSLKSSNISILIGLDKVQVIACRCPHCELSGVCSHIVVVSITRLNTRSRNSACRTFI
jgi:hypothetical protein